MRRFITLAIGGAIIFFLWIPASTQNEIERRQEIIERLANLRDRARQTPLDEKALQSMIDSTRSIDSFERHAAIGFLGEVGEHAEPAVDDLIAALNRADPFEARAAAISLGKIGPVGRRAVPALKVAVQEYPHSDIGWFSAIALGNIADPDDQSVIDILIQASKESDEILRRNALEALDSLERRKD